MLQACCPTCNRPFPKPKTAKPSILAVNTAELSDADLFKHYAVTGPLYDVEFALKSPSVTGDLREAYKALRIDMAMSTIAGKRPGKPLIDRYVNLQDRLRAVHMAIWRDERLQDAADRQAELDMREETELESAVA